MNRMADWYRVSGLATLTVATLAGFATEILRFCRAGF
jgi:hypothetical protein